MRQVANTPYKRMKARARRAFQRWVCLRDCDLYQKNGMFASCISCNKLKHFKDLQGGHWLDGSHTSTLFEANNCHAQCRQCNNWTTVKVKDTYRENLVKKIGSKEMERIEQLHHSTKEYTAQDLESIYLDYKSRLKEAGITLKI